MQEIEEEGDGGAPTDPAHAEPDESRPNPGDPGPPVPSPRTNEDPLEDPRLPLTEKPQRGV